MSIPGWAVLETRHVKNDGIEQQALDFVAALAEKRPACEHCIIDYRLSRETWEKALKLQTRSFFRLPSADLHLAVGETARRKGDCEKIRQQ